MAKLLGNPEIFGHGGAYGYPSWDNPGIRGQAGEGGHMAVHPGILRQGGGGHMAVHRRIIPGLPSYLRIPGYLDKGGHMAVHPWIILG